MNKYVITGASGHIGNNLVRYILEKEPDAKIVALTRRVVGSELDGLNVEQVIGDINNIEYLEKNIDSNDIVVHCAGYIDLKDKHKNLSYDINYLSTKNLCDVCEKCHVRKFVYLGSSDAILRNKNTTIISEPEKYYPEKIHEYYGKTKAMAMQYLLDRMNSNTTFNAVMIIPTAVIGANDFKPSAVGKVVQRVISGKTEIGINGGYNFVDVEDVAKVIYLACYSEARGQYIVSGYDVSVKEMYEKINNLLGIKRKPIILPIIFAYIAMPFSKVLNKVTIKALRDSYNFDCTKAENVLGYSKTNIDDTFVKLVEWFKKINN